MESREGPAASACPPVRVGTRERGPSFSQSFVNSPKREADATSGAPKRRSRGRAMRHAVMRRGMTSHTFDATVMCAGPINHAVVHVRDRTRPSDKLNRGGLRQTEAAERYDHEHASDYTQPLHGVSPLRPNRRDINRSSDGAPALHGPQEPLPRQSGRRPSGFSQASIVRLFVRSFGPDGSAQFIQLDVRREPKGLRRRRQRFASGYPLGLLTRLLVLPLIISVWVRLARRVREVGIHRHAGAVRRVKPSSARRGQPLSPNARLPRGATRCPDGELSRCRVASAKCRRLKNCQAVATAVRQVSIAVARSARCVWAEVR